MKQLVRPALAKAATGKYAGSPPFFEEILSCFEFSAMKKEINWDKIVKEVDRFKDGAGRSVDRGIRDTVTFLRCLDIYTSASCEGHLEHAFVSPWIDVTSPISAKLEHEREILLKQNELGEAYRLLKKIRKLNLREGIKLLPYLKEFYKTHNAPFEQRLIIQVWGHDYARLQSQGLEFQQVLSAQKRKANLKAYQKEMQRFSQFLKKWLE